MWLVRLLDVLLPTRTRLNPSAIPSTGAPWITRSQMYPKYLLLKPITYLFICFLCNCLLVFQELDDTWWKHRVFVWRSMCFFHNVNPWMCRWPLLQSSASSSLPTTWRRPCSWMISQIFQCFFQLSISARGCDCHNNIWRFQHLLPVSLLATAGVLVFLSWNWFLFLASLKVTLSLANLWQSSKIQPSLVCSSSRFIWTHRWISKVSNVKLQNLPVIDINQYQSNSWRGAKTNSLRSSAESSGSGVSTCKKAVVFSRKKNTVFVDV